MNHMRMLKQILCRKYWYIVWVSDKIKYRHFSFRTSVGENCGGVQFSRLVS